jgi:hypothetical protein
MPKDMAVANPRSDCGRPRDDQIGKLFVAVGRNVRKCLVCEQHFTRRAASEHAEVNCYAAVEFCLLEPTQGGKHGSQ